MTIDNTPPPPGYVKCDVTGKIVPEDETVVISGKRVCAEGKQILLERLRSGEMMPGELEKPSVGRRFGCIFVDNLLMRVIDGAIGFAGLAVVGTMQPTTSSAVATQLGFQTVVALIILSYFGFMHAARGQTLGKMAGKLKVVRRDGSPIDAGIAWRRAFFYAGPQLVGPMIAAVCALVSVEIAGIASIVTGLAILGYGLANVICALNDKEEQRALHDRLAGTRVIVVRA